jgi:hypothetical protein
MAYIFPKRKLRSDDVLDPVELNQDFTPAAELASGNLDQHNFSSSVNLTVASEAYWKIHYSQQEADPGMGSPGSPNFPIPSSSWAASNNGDQINNDGSWGALSTVSETFTSGTTNLLIIAQVQYFWEGWTASGAQHTSGGTSPAKIQFALRVNGNILSETVTGKSDPNERSAVPVVPENQRNMVASSSGTDMPGPALNYNVNTNTIGPECFAARITATIEVPAGTQTVEVVARRLPITSSGASGLAPYADTNRVWAMNRQLLVLETPSYPISATEFSSVDAPAFDSEDTISASSLGAARIDKIRNSLNKIQPGATARGAFTHYHLPSMMGAGTQQKVLDPAASFEPAGGTVEYPGFGSTTFTTTAGTSGWYLVGYGGTDLLSDAITIDEPCTLIILGNLQFRRAYDRSTTGKQLWNFGCFCIGYKLSTSSRTMDAETEAVVNSYNFAGNAGTGGKVGKGQILEEINVPLMQVLEFSSTTANVDNIGIYCSTTSGGGGTPVPSLILQRGSLTILHLKKGS